MAEDSVEEQGQPDGVVIYNGKRSDASCHSPMLNNPAANKVADQAALDQMMAIGLTQEEALALITPNIKP